MMVCIDFGLHIFVVEVCIVHDFVGIFVADMMVYIAIYMIVLVDYIHNNDYDYIYCSHIHDLHIHDLHIHNILHSHDIHNNKDYKKDYNKKDYKKDYKNI